MDSGSESSLETDSASASVVRSKKCTKQSKSRSGGATPAVNCVASSGLRCQTIAAAKQVHQGHPSFANAYLFFAGTLLLTMSCTLLCSGVWCLLVRLPMIHLVHGPASILVALTGYMVAAGVLTFPASCILYSQHNVTHRQRPLPPVIALLSICTIFLICGAGHAIVYRKSAYSDLRDSATSSVSVSPNSATATYAN